MRVLFLAGWFPSRVFPTHGNFVARHARLLAQSHQLGVVSVQHDPGLPLGKLDILTKAQDGYELIQVYFGQPKNTPQWRKLWLRFQAYRKGMQLARTTFGRPEILHAHVLLDAGIAASIWAKIWGLPFVITEHSTAYWSPPALNGFRAFLGRWACRRAAFILPVTPALGRVMREQNGLPGRYQAIGNIVDTELFTHLPPPKTEPFIFLHVSNFRDWHKNISGLLRAFKAATETSEHPLLLQLAGDGNLEELQSSIAQARLPAGSVRTSGPHGEQEIARLLQQSHAFVLFSNVENQPVVILEALSSGRPCIATRVGGLPDLINSKNGLLLDPGDEMALTASFLQIVDKYSTYNLPAIRQQVLPLCSPTAVSAAFYEVYQKSLKPGIR